MEHRSGPEGMDRRATLRLVDTDGADVWEADPAPEADDLRTLDDLAELFIGGDLGAEALDTDDRPRAGVPFAREPEPAERVEIEAIITGHLPVRGAVWVRAYAAQVARGDGGPVALVRVTPERTSVELVGSSVDAEPVTDIETAIRAAGCGSTHWLLHFDELDQVSLLRSGEIDRVTVLSGADEPAIVGAYRLIKTMADGGDQVEGVGVAIVGADPANTARASERLVNATRQFLGLSLEIRPHVPRVKSASVALLGDSDRRYEPAEVLEMIAERPGRAAPGPMPASIDQDSIDGCGDLPSPSALVPDLRPLGVPCPVAPSVELASDNAGRLHLLCWWSPEAPGELLKASAWSRVNLPLLHRICQGLNAQQCAPAQHLLCVDLGIAADLHGTNTLVHLAMPAERIPASGWLCGRVN